MILNQKKELIMKIEFTSKNVLLIFILAVFVLFIFNFIDIVSIYYLDNKNIWGGRFSFNKEGNFPSLYSAFSIFFASVLLYIIAQSTKGMKEYYYWLGLSFIFLFLSLDEWFSLHEKLASPTRELLFTSGIFAFAWIIPYSVVLLIFTLVYLRFLFYLPKKTKYLFVTAGIIYVAGALGMEMVGGMIYEMYGRHNLYYAIEYTIEESLEMIGIVIFIYALMDYICKNVSYITLRIKE